MSTVKVTNLQNASSASPNIVLDSSGNATMAGSMAMATPFAMKNKIINGAMEIDQRNAGAEVNPAVGSSYYLDRWMAISSAAGKFKIGQNAGSVTPPAGFSKYLGVTSLSSYSVGASEAFGIRQIVEGLNIVDLAWGTANAKTITISFWVRSSLTGTFGLGLGNDGFSRAYPASYTISSANTWEYKTVTIAGDTTGTWLTTNSVGLYLTWQIGYGSSYSGTANAWNAGTAFAPTGAVSVVGTNGATFYLTGVQLEVGTVATPFERRLYPQELVMCQRYYSKTYMQSTVPGTDTVSGLVQTMNGQDGNQIGGARWKVTMRAAPTVSVWSKGGTAATVSTTSYANGPNAGSWAASDISDDGCRIIVGTGGLTAATAYNFHYVAAAEL